MKDLVQTARDYLLQGIDLGRDWLLRPAAWSQVAPLVGAYPAALVVSKLPAPRIRRLLTPKDGAAAL